MGKQCQTLFWGAPKSLQMVVSAMKLKARTPWKESYNQPRQHIRRRQWQPTPVLLPGKILWMEVPGRLQSMGSLRVRYDWVSSLSLSCIGEGNGNPLQCSCLENPRDGGAWWAAVYGVAQIRTLLKQLSSSSLYVVLIGWLLDCTLLWLAHSSLYFVLIGWLLAQFSLIGWLKAC